MTAARHVLEWLRQCGRKRPKGSTVALAVLHLLSLAVLLVMLVAAVVNRRISPFYTWIKDTPVEKLGLRIVDIVSNQDRHWRRRLAGGPLLAEEAAARDNLIEAIKRDRPTHGLLVEGKGALFGRLETLEPGRCRLEFEDEDGQHVRELTDAQIVWRKRIAYPPVELMPEDIRFLLDFPDCKYYYMPPYLFVSDAPYSYVHLAYEILGDLSSEFLREFRLLTTRESGRKLVYVCFFREEETYLRHAIEKEDVCLAQSVGFYSKRADCLFVYDRLHSFARARTDHSIERLATNAGNGRDEGFRGTIRRLANDQKERAYELLRRQVSRTLRHEGAHQLAFSLGIHSRNGSEHLWLEEGLAQYCETMPIGQEIRQKLALLKRVQMQRRLIPWQDLVNTPTPEGYSHYDDRAEVAYAQAWLLFHYLMQKPYRARFMRYLDSIRTLRHAETRQRTEILERVLEKPFLEIALALNALIEQVSSPAPDAREETP